MSDAAPDILGWLGLAASMPSPLQTIEDVSTLYKIVQAGKPDFTAMDSAGTLEPAAESLGRLGALIAAKLKDPNQREAMVSLLSTIGGML